jgi:ubiquinone/menaquinone biosynthesis C-methylase UbiE
MTVPDEYVLGYRQAEQERLQQQALQLAHESRSLFDHIGVAAGYRVVEIGCGPHGCLEILAERVGPTGRVVGIERSPDAVDLARKLVKERDLTNVEVVCGDARSTGLPRGAFDVATARLVLVNVPEPQQIVAEAVAIVRPGGLVAFHEADWIAHVCDPPSAAWTRMVELFVEFAENLSERILAQGLTVEHELAEVKDALRRHIHDPGTTVISHLFLQAWGRKRA